MNQIGDLKKKLSELSLENQRLQQQRFDEAERVRQTFAVQSDKDRFELTKLRGQSL